MIGSSGNLHALRNSIPSKEGSTPISTFSTIEGGKIETDVHTILAAQSSLRIHQIHPPQMTYPMSNQNNALDKMHSLKANAKRVSCPSGPSYCLTDAVLMNGMVRIKTWN